MVDVTRGNFAWSTVNIIPRSINVRLVAPLRRFELSGSLLAIVTIEYQSVSFHYELRLPVRTTVATRPWRKAKSAELRARWELGAPA